MRTSVCRIAMLAIFGCRLLHVMLYLQGPCKVGEGMQRWAWTSHFRTVLDTTFCPKSSLSVEPCCAWAV